MGVLPVSARDDRALTVIGRRKWKKPINQFTPQLSRADLGLNLCLSINPSYLVSLDVQAHAKVSFQFEYQISALAAAVNPISLPL